MCPASFKKLYGGFTKEKVTTKRRFSRLDQQKSDQLPLSTEEIVASIQSLRRERESRSGSPKSPANKSTSALNFLSPSASSFVAGYSSSRLLLAPSTSRANSSHTAFSPRSECLAEELAQDHQFRADLESLAPSTRPSSTLSIATQRNLSQLHSATITCEEGAPPAKRAALDDPDFLADLRSLESSTPSVSFSHGGQFDEVEVDDLSLQDDDDEADNPKIHSVFNELRDFLTDNEGYSLPHKSKDKANLRICK